jgi:hypothetical protein
MVMWWECKTPEAFRQYRGMCATFEHVTPKCNGGGDGDTVAACLLCNQIRGHLSHDQFMYVMQDKDRFHNWLKKSSRHRNQNRRIETKRTLPHPTVMPLKGRAKKQGDETFKMLGLTKRQHWVTLAVDCVRQQRNVQAESQLSTRMQQLHGIR